MIAPPNWAIGWDVFCWIGHRRCAHHMSIPLIQSELLDDYAIKLSDDAIAKYIRRYQVMLAARQQDPKPCVANTNRSMRSCCQLTGCNPRRDTRLSMS